MNVVDGYFAWLGKGGPTRIAVGLVLPVVATLGIAAAAVNGGGDDPADAVTAASPTAVITATQPAAAVTTSSLVPAIPTSTSVAPAPTATSAPPAATSTQPPAPTATSAATVQQLVATQPPAAAVIPTTAPTQAPLPISTPVPPAPPTATRIPPAPTATRAPTGGYLPGNAYNCGDFANYAQAKAYFDAVPGDPSKLDADNDGIPCESLPGAP